MLDEGHCMIWYGTGTSSKVIQNPMYGSFKISSSGHSVANDRLPQSQATSL